MHVSNKQRGGNLRIFFMKYDTKRYHFQEAFYLRFLSLKSKCKYDFNFTKENMFSETILNKHAIKHFHNILLFFCV
jgi:hypothetical protein